MSTNASPDGPAATGSADDAEQRLSPGARRWVLAATVVLWVACSAFLASAIPPGDAPDENAHLEYVDHLSKTWRFADFRTQHPATEMHQPPLYYLAGAALRAAGAPLFLLRLLSTLFGAVTLVAVYHLARQWRPRAGFFFHWACAAAVGFLPMSLYISSALNNDAMVNAWVALGLLHLWRTRAADPGRRAAAVSGLLAGLAMLTKSTALAFLVTAVVWYGVPLLRPAEKRAAAGRLACFLGTLAVVWGPWALRNTLLYGDPLAAGAFAAHSSHVGVPVEEFGAPHASYWLQWVIPWTWRTAWGAYGHLVYVDDFMPEAWYAAFIPLALVAAAGLALRVRPGAWDPQRRLLAGALFLGGLVLLAGYVRFNLNVFQAQARYFFCYLPVAVVLLCTGLEKVHPRGGRWAVAVLLLLLAVGCADGVGWRMWFAAPAR